MFIRVRGLNFAQCIQMLASVAACAVVCWLSALVLTDPFGFQSTLSEALAWSLVALDGLALFAVICELLFLKLGS